MRSIKDDMYDDAFRLWDMVPAGTVPGYGSAGSVYRFANGCGHGEYWATSTTTSSPSTPST